MATSLSVLGHAVQRREDPDLLRGRARYVADLPAPGELRAVFVRSQQAHARIVGIDTEEAATAPGVVAVLTAGDLKVGDLGEQTQPGGPRPGQWRPAGGPRQELARPCLARDRLRFVGESYAVVVADTQAAAVDAAELVLLEAEELPPVTDPEAAAGEGSELLFPEHGTNLVVDMPPDDDGDVLEGSDVVVSARFFNQRLAAVPIEPNGALAVPGPDGDLTLWVSTQSAFRVRTDVCATLGLEPSAVRVVAPAVGGGFGAKGGTYPEQVIVAALALRLGRPVRWVETRSENLLAMTQGRAQVQEVELGARSDGTLVGYRTRTLTDFGAYTWRGAFSTGTTRVMGAGVYRLPRICQRSMGVVTNKSPLGPYRGAGRPEATAMIERSMDLLAAELGIDPAEIRRRNFVRPEEFPFRAVTGALYDSGQYELALDQALSLAGYEELRAEQRRRREAADPRLLGIGISCFIEISGSGGEYGAVRVEEDGTVTVHSGSSPHGQGHETVFAQVAASVLKVDLEAVRVLHSDTGLVARGVGTFGSRSGQLAGSAIFRAGEAVVAKARELAAQLLEADPDDVVQQDDGTFAVAGVPTRSLSWGELARQAEAGEGLKPMESGLAAEVDFTQPDSSFPFGAHVAVVEIDSETGHVELRRIVAVDDCGTVLNPLVVTGQVHGGLAQGIAQALFEAVEHDDTGTPLATTLAEYLVPSAADLPSFDLGHTVTPSPRNPLGAKGVGEAGTVGSAPAIQNAVLDALAPYGVRHLDMPLAPERVWRAIQGI
ncbi:MAG: xanthine dehydrogenase family protein molybdopterin-binding subunit [Acidimicrobiales bacterium]